MVIDTKIINEEIILIIDGVEFCINDGEELCLKIHKAQDEIKDRLHIKKLKNKLKRKNFEILYHIEESSFGKHFVFAIKRENGDLDDAYYGTSDSEKDFLQAITYTAGLREAMENCYEFSEDNLGKITNFLDEIGLIKVERLWD